MFYSPSTLAPEHIQVAGVANTIWAPTLFLASGLAVNLGRQREAGKAKSAT
jgi:hypothetical protein